MAWALPLTVAAPLLAAAGVVATEHVGPRQLQNAIAIAGASAATAFSLLAMVEAESGQPLHWFGGWEPRAGVAIGIDFTADPFGAGMAALSSGLVLVALVYSWTFLREASRLYDVLVLLFLAALCGFSLTGDLFNMFVWLELLGVAAYALAGFQVEELGPVQGAFNFAITNSVGGFLFLLGIALLYGHTGALNLAQIGDTLSGERPRGVLVVAATLLLAGLFVKAAIVPFHMWAADAHAVAPAPVAALFSALELQVGLLGIARLYWTAFDASFADRAGAIRGVLLALGLTSALLGALMCFLQRHLKRMLAYQTISHSGLILVGIALLDSKGLAGAANLVLSHAFLKAGLFLAVGLLLVRFRSVDELRLHGRGRDLPLLGVLFGAGTVGLIGLPYTGTFLGHSLVDGGAASLGWHWLQPLPAVAAGLSAGALLRAGARVFLGWGPKRDDLLTAEPPDEAPERDASYPLLLVTILVTVALGTAASLVPGLEQRSERGADRFRDRSAYVQLVLRGEAAPSAPRLPYALPHATRGSLVWGGAAGALALLVAAFGLWRHRLPSALRSAAARPLAPSVHVLKAVHSGVVGDYLMWITVGTALVGGVWALTLR